MAGNFLDQEGAQKAIAKSLDVIERISFQNSNLNEVKEVYSDFKTVVDEYDFLETTKEVY